MLRPRPARKRARLRRLAGPIGSDDGRRLLLPCPRLGLRPRQHALSAERPALRADRVRMTAYVARTLGVPEAEADRLRGHYWATYGTTLAGLMAEHALDPGPTSPTCMTSTSPRSARSAPRGADRGAAGTQDRLHQRRRPLRGEGAGGAGPHRRLRRGLWGGARGLPSQARAGSLRGGLRARRAVAHRRRYVRGRSAQPDGAAPDGDADGAGRGRGAGADHIHHHTDDLTAFLARLA